jgi:general secretion pathway protein K
MKKGSVYHERGAALLTVMLVFSVAAVITIAMLSKQRLEVAQTLTMFQRAQAYEYVLGTEELARQTLRHDALETPGVDYNGQDWSTLRGGVPVANGYVNSYIEDLQGRFNLNALAGATHTSMWRFQQILAALNLRTTLAKDILTQLVARPGVGHATQITSIVQSVTALRTISGVTEGDYITLSPYVTALPTRESPLNVNTASQTLLEAYLPQKGDLGKLLAKRSQNGFITLQQLRGLGIDTRGMSVSSRFFSVHTQAAIEDRTVTLTTILNRETDKTGKVHIHVVSRDLNEAFQQ